jgi:protein-disulfide isomerase
MRRTSPALTALVASFALCLLPASSLGAEPSAAPEGSPAPTVSPIPFPNLTMAPLSPIVRPADRDPAIPSDGYVLGSADAPVTIEVWEDFQCPYCRLFTQQIEPLIIEAFVKPGTARLVFRDLPFLGEESRWAAVAARLAAQQGRFWLLHDYLFANQLGENVGSYTPERLMTMAQTAGLDMAPFIEGLHVPAARTLFAEIQAEAMADAGVLGISATPTVVVNGVPLATPDFAAVAAAIEAALATGAPSAAPASPVTPSAPPATD